MEYDHEAVRKAYPDTTIIIDDKGCYDLEGKLFTPDEAKVATARVELNALPENQEYYFKRRREYPDWSTQLAYIYDNGIEKWKTDMVDPVKTKYPKPS